MFPHTDLTQDERAVVETHNAAFLAVVPTTNAFTETPREEIEHYLIFLPVVSCNLPLYFRE